MVPATGAGEPVPSDEGVWELDLWNGSAWFNDWFYRRLQWPVQVERHKLADLQPHLTPEAWKTLLLGIRAHLELGTPLDTQIPVQTADRTEWWRIQGSVERNTGGQPVHLSGSARDVTTTRAEPPSDP
jgi:PAS domain-containing protein